MFGLPKKSFLSWCVINDGLNDDINHKGAFSSDHLDSSRLIFLSEGTLVNHQHIGTSGQKNLEEIRVEQPGPFPFGEGSQGPCTGGKAGPYDP